MTKTLRPYQEEALDILSRNPSGLLASGLGSGKTLMAVERVRRLGLGRVPRVLVIAPVGTLTQWADTFAEQYPSLKRNGLLRITGTHKSDPETWADIVAKKPGVYLIGWEAMRGKVDAGTKAAYSRAATKEPKLTVAAVRQAMKDGTIPPWHKAGVFDLVIADEVHRIARRDSGQARVLKLIGATHRLAVSATFSGNRESGAWSVLNWLWKDRYSSFWDWAWKYLHVGEQKVSRSKTVTQVGGELAPGAIWMDIPCAVRHRTEEIGVYLPEVIERVVDVEMGEVQARQYRDFEEQAFAWLDEHPVGTPLPVTQRIRLRQAALGQLKMRDTVKRVSRWVGVSGVDSLLEEWEGDDPKAHGRRRRDVTSFPLNDGECGVFPAREPVRWKAPVSFGPQRTVPGAPAAGCGQEWPAWKGGAKAVTEVRVSRAERVEEIGFAEKGDQPKLAAVKEILRDLPDGEPVLIFTHSSKWAQMAAAEINAAGIYGEARAWTGDLAKGQREDLKRAFGVLSPAGPRSKFSHCGVRVLIAVVAAVAEGIDGWQHRVRCEVWVSEDESMLLCEQAKGRLHRPGQKTPVQRWLIRSQGTIDEKVHAGILLRGRSMAALYQDDLTQGA